MSGLAGAEPIFLRLAPDPVFGLLQTPPDGVSATGVLLCPPWGWEDVASYRSRRIWAEHLAQAGHLTLRFDFPATGDSGGCPGDPRRLDAWSGAIAGAADWLRASRGCGRIAVIGLGLSGLVACKAAAEGARIDDLVLWAAPSRGRAFVRAQRAFSRLQSSRYSLTGETLPSGLPDGWLEVGGFVLSAETVGALDRLDVRALAPPGLQRALLLDRDGIGPDQDLRSRFEEAGVAVTVGSGNGWETMVADPERPEPPLEVIDQVQRWLAQAPAPVAAPPLAHGPAASPDAVLDVDGASISESPLVMQLPFGRIFGLLAEPTGGSSSPLCAVFVNAGAVRRIGPNRMWTEVARQCAARGVPAVRIDLEGIGDADGDGSRYRDVSQFYVQRLVDQVTHVLGELQARDIGRRFVLIGLCSGGYLSFHAAIRHEQVSAALLVNAGALVWDSDLVIRRSVRKLDRLRQLAWWRKILQGKVRAATVRDVVRALAISALRSVRSSGARSPDHADAGRWVDNALDRLRDDGTRVVMAFSADEGLHDELTRDGVLGRLARWPNVTLESLPGRDHTLRHVGAQQAVRDLLERELERELRRAGDRGSLSVP